LLFVVCSPKYTCAFEAFLEPAQVVDISTPFRDRIDIVHVRENDSVKPGTPLAELATRVLKIRLEQALLAAGFHGQIDAARAKVSMQKNRVSMLVKLNKEGNIRPQELRKAKNELTMARAALQSAIELQKLKKSEAAVIEAQIEEKKLASPIKGIVVSVYKQQGELIGGADTQPLLTIAQLNPLHAVFHLPPAISRALLGLRQVPLEVSGKQYSGIIDFISPIIDAQSGTVAVRIIVNNDESDLESGSRCTLTLAPAQRERTNE
jgi:RND family efflux transporter MFP subunit